MNLQRTSTSLISLCSDSGCNLMQLADEPDPEARNCYERHKYLEVLCQGEQYGSNAINMDMGYLTQFPLYPSDYWSSIRE